MYRGAVCDRLLGQSCRSISAKQRAATSCSSNTSVVCLCHQEMSFKCARSQFGQPYVHTFDRAGLQGLALQQKTPHSSSSVKHATAETSSHFVMAQLRNTDNGATRHENPDSGCRSHHSSSVRQGWRGQIDHCRSARTPTVAVIACNSRLHPYR